MYWSWGVIVLGGFDQVNFESILSCEGFISFNEEESMLNFALCFKFCAQIVNWFPELQDQTLVNDRKLNHWLNKQTNLRD